MAYDILGNIAVIYNAEEKTKEEKLELAEELLKRPSVKTVLEKVESVKGRLRKIKVKHVAGVRRLIAEHRENNCVFKFDISDCYFSSRLSNDRKEIASRVGRRDKVLVMFAGIGVYPIVIYKIAKPLKVVGVEISRACCKWFKENLKLNKISLERVSVIQGDVKKKINKSLGKFDVIMMARPNLKESFLDVGLRVAKRRSLIFYHLFCHESKLDEEVEKLEGEAVECGRKIKVAKIVKIGNIAPYKFRYRVEMRVVR